MAESKPWDSTLKRLILINPSAFVKWLLPDAIFVRELPRELQSQQREVDALVEVFLDEESVLLHIEFQTYSDPKMADCLLSYNILTRSTYNLPVVSWVIYLLESGSIQQSPFSITLRNGKKINDFYYDSTKIGQLTPEDIIKLGITALIPLLPLTKGGAERTTLLQMFETLKVQREPNETERQATELELIAFTLASLVLRRKNSIDLEWLIRRFREMHDIIREAPIYQEILREGLEQGLEQGIEQGRKTSIDILLMLTNSLFPSLVDLLREQVTPVKDLNTLQDLAAKILSAKTVDEARTYILSLDKKLDA